MGFKGVKIIWVCFRDKHLNVCCVYSLESPESPPGGDSNEYTHHTIMVLRSTRHPKSFLPPDLALWSILSGSNYLCLELIFMLPQLSEPLKLDCTRSVVVPKGHNLHQDGDVIKAVIMCHSFEFIPKSRGVQKASKEQQQNFMHKTCSF